MKKPKVWLKSTTVEFITCKMCVEIVVTSVDTVFASSRWPFHSWYILHTNPVCAKKPKKCPLGQNNELWDKYSLFKVCVACCYSCIVLTNISVSHCHVMAKATIGKLRFIVALYFIGFILGMWTTSSWNCWSWPMPAKRLVPVPSSEWSRIFHTASSHRWGREGQLYPSSLPPCLESQVKSKHEICDTLSKR